MTDGYMHEARQRGIPVDSGTVMEEFRRWSQIFRRMVYREEENGRAPAESRKSRPRRKGRIQNERDRGQGPDEGLWPGPGNFRGELFPWAGAKPWASWAPNGAGKTTTLRHLMGFLHPIPARPAFWEWTASGRRRKSRSIWATCRGDRLSRRHAGRRVPPVPGRNEREEGPGQGKGTFRTV